MTELPDGPLRAGGETGGLSAEAARQLTVRFFGLLRVIHFYGATNGLVQRQLQGFLAALQESGEEEVALVGLGTYLYVNGTRVRPRGSQASIVQHLLVELESHAVGAIRFMRGVSADELEAFLVLFSQASGSASCERLPDALLEAGVSNVVLVRARDLGSAALVPEDAPPDDEQGEGGRARRTFFRAVAGTRNLIMRAEQTQRPALRQAKRLVQPLVDALMRDEYSIIGLTALKNHDEYTYAHCVNVSVLSIRMGQVLGLRRDELANLGVAALLHDVGKIAVPAEVLNKPGKLSEQEWESIRSHPLEGLKLLARMPGWSALTLGTMNVCFQHHVNMDGSGYPRLDHAGQPSVFSRIVSVADVFDAITMHRAYRKRAFTSYEALHHLAVAERRNFDPAVLWALVESVGLFPAGTVMQSASGFLLLSMGPSQGDLARPPCRVLQLPGGGLPHETTDWAALPESEQIVRVLSPEEHQLDTSALLAA